MKVAYGEKAVREKLQTVVDSETFILLERYMDDQSIATISKCIAYILRQFLEDQYAKN